MLKKDIKVGGHYTAKVSGKLTTVRVEEIGERSDGRTYYSVLNLTTNRGTTFRSAQKFRGEVRVLKQPKILPMPSKPVIIENTIGMTAEQIIGVAVKQAEDEQLGPYERYHEVFNCCPHCGAHNFDGCDCHDDVVGFPANCPSD